MKANSFVRTVLLLPSPHEAIFVQNRGAVFHESRMLCRKQSLVERIRNISGKRKNDTCDGLLKGVVY
jgi:hypothetical protein